MVWIFRISIGLILASLGTISKKKKKKEKKMYRSYYTISAQLFLRLPSATELVEKPQRKFAFPFLEALVFVTVCLTDS